MKLIDKFNLEQEKLRLAKESMHLDSGVSIELKSSKHIPFPIEVFPDWVKDHILNQHKFNDGIVDFMGLSFLWALSVSIRTTASVHIYNGWIEPATIWGVCVGSSGISKSPSMGFMKKPLDVINRREYDMYKSNIKVWNQLSKQEKMYAQEPIDGMVYQNEITIESLLKKSDMSGKGTGLFMDELSGWFNSLENHPTAKSHYLSAFSGSGLSFSTKTQGEGYIENPFWAVLGSTQPSILTSIASESNVGSGLMMRFLIALPKNERKRKTNREINNTNSSSIYNERFDYLHSLISSKSKLTINLSGDAIDSFINYKDELSENHNSGLLTSIEKSYIPKIIIYAARIALVLHVAWADESKYKVKTDISKDTMDKSILLCRYFMNSVAKAFRGVQKQKDFNNITKTKMSPKERVKAAHEIGMSVSELMEISGKSQDTIYRWIRELKT